MTNKQRDLVQYFVVNKDVNMSRGKTAAQVAHAATLSTLELVSAKSSFMDRQPDFVEWLQTGMKKIILKGSQAELEKLEKAGFFSIRDSGLTEIQKGSLTVTALPPMDKWEAKGIVGHLTLLKN
ncbi:aminoacyl-tRNA hydrolase [Rossellomorea aquimaris]|jgi:peptidyl-tRNA hydrolase, PTH2 family|uniref:peptidyl-tRNA hydrolase n=1 Tax=Rossellomorea aquimaris TaxID=189382 RepID=A0A1J6W1D1_9BACI|nr:aminoacyl-tRNA hydrolase [Rossellomorea aquimaris]OIU71405.1 peptidyl-tRNA hydrolase [Rossellomorea aquimaris]